MPTCWSVRLRFAEEVHPRPCKNSDFNFPNDLEETGQTTTLMKKRILLLWSEQVSVAKAPHGRVITAVATQSSLKPVLKPSQNCFEMAEPPLDIPRDHLKFQICCSKRELRAPVLFRKKESEIRVDRKLPVVLPKRSLAWVRKAWASYIDYLDSCPATN